MKNSRENESDTEDAKKSGAKVSGAILQCSLGTDEKIVYKVIRPKNHQSKNQSSDSPPNGIESSSNAPFDQDDEMNQTRALKHCDSGYAEKSDAQKKDVIETDFQEVYSKDVDAKEGDAKDVDAKEGDAKDVDAKEGDAKDGDANYILPSEIEFTTQVQHPSQIP